MRTYKKLGAKECAEAIQKIKDPVILIHVRPDGDTVASGAALCEIFRQLGSEATLLCADKIPERLAFILERTDTNVSECADGKTTVSIDVASPAQLGTLKDTAPKPILMIDHHEVGEQFADGYIKPDASSAAEALMDIARELEAMGKIRFNSNLAFALYTAISSDTGCFAYSNATAKTHRYAADLIEYGIDSADINRRLFSSKSKEQINAEGIVASKTETSKSGQISFATLSYNELNQNGLSPENFETAIDVVRSLRGSKIAFVIKETERNKYKVSLRSVGADVASVASRFGGGGHMRAAGCSPDAKSMEEAKTLILEAIEDLI